MSFDFSTLITDRAQTDIARANDILSRANAGTATPDELEELYSGRLKGSYDYTDLNRVASCILELEKVLTGYGYKVFVNAKNGWTNAESQTKTLAAAYLKDVAEIRDALVVLPGTPSVPVDLVKLTIDEANDIEKILLSVKGQIGVMEQTFVPCGPATCGGDYL